MIRAQNADGISILVQRITIYELGFVDSERACGQFPRVIGLRFDELKLVG